MPLEKPLIISEPQEYAFEVTLVILEDTVDMTLETVLETALFALSIPFLNFPIKSEPLDLNSSYLSLIALIPLETTLPIFLTTELFEIPFLTLSISVLPFP